MSTDRSVTTDLMEVLQDGRDGFAHAAEQLRDSDRPELADSFAQFSAQRAGFYDELDALAATYGDDVDESGSAGGSLHRAWISVKSTLSGSDPAGILKAAETGEDHAVKAYTDALGQDLSPELRTVVENQFTQVRATHDQVAALGGAAS